MSYILAIDQGTSSSKAILFDADFNVVLLKQKEFRQIYPKAGWVEHDPEEIWQSVVEVCTKVVDEAKAKNLKIEAIGITNQRETTILWDRKTGKSIYNAIVWQDRRTASMCEELKSCSYNNKPVEEFINSKTGLLIDPYFSATKIAWILQNVEGAMQKAKDGEIIFGTVDSFLLWKLSAGKVHATDATNAARTMLFDIEKGKWNNELYDIFNIPKQILPQVVDCSGNFASSLIFGSDYKMPICAMIGDQQAALIGQGCFAKNSAKSTYGTGCFVMVNTGSKPVYSKNRLLTTIACSLAGKTTYAVEGSIFIAGAAVTWLKDGLKIIGHANETERLAAECKGNNGVYLVPAFTGLGTPHWRFDVRGVLCGIGRDTGVAHITRAALESIAYQTHDLLAAMQEDGLMIETLKVDGGMTGNNWLMQFLADILSLKLECPVNSEATATGAAYLAALGAGIYSDLADIKPPAINKQFTAKMTKQEKEDLLAGWRQAVSKCLA